MVCKTRKRVTSSPTLPGRAVGGMRKLIQLRMTMEQVGMMYLKTYTPEFRFMVTPNPTCE